jgi:K+-transporting ATPase ATPase A chain
MGWLNYAFAILLFNLLGVLAGYALQRLQAWLPLNPQAFASVSPDSAFNTALSFATNTNWQGYGGESTMSYLTQMLALAVQNFFSAATGIVVVIALVRGFARHTAKTVGNAWVDLTRSTLYVLLPLSIIYAVFLTSQGVIQNFDAYQEVATLEVTSYETPKLDAAGQPVKDERGVVLTESAASLNPDAGHGSGRITGSDQAAGHQRWRLLQRQLGASV